jgi:hypothetical protein
MNLVVFPAWPLIDAEVPKSALWQLPNTPLRHWMIEKHMVDGVPGDRDLDSPPAIWVLRRDYVTQFRRVSFSHWVTPPSSTTAVPAFRDDPTGRTVVATGRSQSIITSEWWRALKNPGTWHATTPPPALPPPSPDSLTFRASQDFSGVQGNRGWSYRDSLGPMRVFDGRVWKGSEDYLWLWGTGGHPGASRDAVRRFVVPQGGSATVTATVAEQQIGCGDGVTVKVLHRGGALWQRDRPKGTAPESLALQIAVTSGDVIDFVIGRRGNSVCDTTHFDSTIVLTPGGVPPAPAPASSPSTVTFRASADFAGKQGTRGWFYYDSRGFLPTFSRGIWKGTEDYLWLWGKGGHPGATRDVIRRFIVPQNGTATISATVVDQQPGCGDGVRVALRHQGLVLWQRERPDATPPESFMITVAVSAGDPLDFVIGRRGDSVCDTTGFDPTIELTPGS